MNFSWRKSHWGLTQVLVVCSVVVLCFCTLVTDCFIDFTLLNLQSGIYNGSYRVIVKHLLWSYCGYGYKKSNAGCFWMETGVPREKPSALLG